MRKGIKTLAMWLIIGIIVIVLLSSIIENNNAKMTYSELVTSIENSEVESIKISSDGTIANVKLKDSRIEKEVSIPSLDSFMTYVGEYLKTGEFTLEEEKPSMLITILSLITPFGLLIIFCIFWLIMMSGSNQGGSKTMSFGKSKARLVNAGEKNRVTFDDVAGVDEEKEELQEIVEFLKNPKKFTDMGARIPKGVLLVGQPGTGKTLLAKAVAGEAGVPFYIISGSDFVEMFVGVGASRVRDLFEQAKRTAPCIIFIDEIDAVGRQRGAGLGGGHDEREQTLNQLLVEMDGFSDNEGVIILAATNRPDVLDKALLRAGRFDRQIVVSSPDVKAREQILEVHARKKKLADDVDLKIIAKNTSGFAGADLENVLNEAALLAARENRKIINTQDIDEAIDRVMMGPAKKSRKISDSEKNLIAHHEAGHAIIGLKLENANIVQKVTIIPRGQAGGYALMLPEEERYLETKQSLLDRITGYLGGRVSEEINFHEVSTGASNDFQQATKIARAMVTEYGMSNLGPVQYEQPNGSVFLGRDYLKEKNFSDQIALEIDKETRNIIEECYERARKVILENLDLLKKIAYYLIKVETLTKSDIEEIEATGSLKWYEDKQKALAEEKNKPVEETTQETHTSNNNVEDNAQEHLDKTNDSNDIVISKPEDNDNETR